MIETGCGGEKRSERLIREMRARRLPPEKVHTVALSHVHLDHMGGITTFLSTSLTLATETAGSSSTPSR